MITAAATDSLHRYSSQRNCCTKTNTEDWSQAVRGGQLTQALRSLNPRRKTGPWTILCDGEAFLRAKDSLAAYRSKKIVLWGVPAKSPDLNPVEKYWSWVRRQMRAMDLADLSAKRPAAGRAEMAGKGKT